MVQVAKPLRPGWIRAVLVAVPVALLLAMLAGGSGTSVPAAAQAPQGATPVASPTPATLNITGHGSVTLAPDTAAITVGVQITQPRLADAQRQATEQMTAIIAAVRAGGVEDKDIQTTNYSVSILYQYDDNGYPQRITGYQVSNQVTVVIRAEDTLGELLDAVVTAGANNIFGISFYVDDPSAAASQARQAAVADARRKAEELATAAGMRIKRIVSISETYAPPPMPLEFAESRGAADMAAAAPVPIQSGSSEVTVDVQIYYELEEAS